MQFEALKISVIILTLCCCVTPMKVQVPQESFAFPIRISLSNTKFFDGMRFGDSTEGFSFYYTFDEDTYEINVYTRYSEPYETYVVERGEYVVDYSRLTLMPMERIQCEVGDFPFPFPCTRTKIYTEVYFEHRDSIKEKDLEQYGFMPRTINLSLRNDTIVFKDPFISSFGYFEQVFR